MNTIRSLRSSTRKALNALVIGGIIASVVNPAPALAATDCTSIQPVGHRGEIARDRTENTARSLEYAAANGAGGVEFDIRLSKDRQWVLMHDATVGRTTNGSGYVSRRHAGTITGTYLTNDSRVVGMRLHAPLLNEVINGNGTNMQTGLAQKYPTLRYQVEFKPSKRATVEDVARALDILTANAPESQVVATSTSMSMLDKINAARPSVARAYISLQSPTPQALLPILQARGIQYANVGFNSVNTEFVDQAHALGLNVSLRGARTPDQWLYALSLNPDSLVMDYPSQYVAWCQEYTNTPPALRKATVPKLTVPKTYVQPD